jgi:biopolymer transport protein ExbB/TolQ
MLELLMEIFNALIDSGGLELFLAATGMGAAVPAVVMYKRMRKAKKMKEQILG